MPALGPWHHVPTNQLARILRERLADAEDIAGELESRDARARAVAQRLAEAMLHLRRRFGEELRG